MRRRFLFLGLIGLILLVLAIAGQERTRPADSPLFAQDLMRPFLSPVASPSRKGQSADRRPATALEIEPVREGDF